MLSQESHPPTNHPNVNAVVKGLARLRGTACRQVKALREYHIKKMLNICDLTSSQSGKKLICLRDAAILAIGFAGALRRSEICGLTTDDIEIIPSFGGQKKNVSLYSQVKDGSRRKRA